MRTVRLSARTTRWGFRLHVKLHMPETRWERLQRALRWPPRSGWKPHETVLGKVWLELGPPGDPTTHKWGRINGQDT